MVLHYADAVEYNASGWTEKNQDKLPVQLQGLVGRSRNEILVAIFPEVREAFVEMTWVVRIWGS